MENAFEIHIHVHHHFDSPLMIGRARQPATAAHLNVKEKELMTTVNVTVDTVNEIAAIQFVDDKGDTDALQPEGSVVAFASSNPDVLSVSVREDNPLVADLVVVAEGDADVSATVTDADGNDLVDDAGNPWAPILSTTVHVAAGEAVGARLSVSEG